MTDWIKPGAAIAVYIDGREGSHRLRITTVKRVASQSFTVEGLEERFKLATLESKRVGSPYSSWRYIATHPDSEEAKKVQRRDQRDRLKTSVFRYLHNDADSLDQVDDAIRRLTKWRAVLAAEVKS